MSHSYKYMKLKKKKGAGKEKLDTGCQRGKAFVLPSLLLKKQVTSPACNPKSGGFDST